MNPVKMLQDHLPRFRKMLHVDFLLDKVQQEYLDKLFQTVNVPQSSLVTHQAELKTLMNLMLTLQEEQLKVIKEDNDIDD